MGLKLSLNSAFTKIGVLRATFGIRVSAILKVFDRQDLLFFGGLSFVGYGLNSNYSPGTACIVVGGILAAVGLVGSILGGTK
jgi:hypothetical protein